MRRPAFFRWLDPKRRIFIDKILSIVRARDGTRLLARFRTWIQDQFPAELSKFIPHLILFGFDRLLSGCSLARPFLNADGERDR